VYPIYDVCSDNQVGKYIRSGDRPYIDRRWLDESFAEAELVRIINECWHQHRENRPSIGELVLMLRDSVQKNRELLAKGRTKLEDDFAFEKVS